MRKYYPGLTLFKFVGAVMVVLTHIRQFPLNPLLDSYIPLFSALCAVVVPCFYTMAGFLACKGWMQAARPGQYIRLYAGWILKVYALFCLLYLFTDPLSVVRSGSFTSRSLASYVEPFLIVGPYAQLWFILPMLLAVLLGYWAERRRQLVALGVVALLGLLLAVCVIGPLQVVARPALTWLPLYQYRHWGLIKLLIGYHLGSALPFVLAGICIARRETWFVQLNKWLLIGPALLWSIAELTLLGRLYPGGYPGGILLAHLPLTLLLFYALLNVQSKWVQPYHAYLRQLSLFLYFTHWPVMLFSAWLIGTKLWLLSPGQTALCIALTFGQILLLERLVAWAQRRHRQRKALVLNRQTTLSP